MISREGATSIPSLGQRLSNAELERRALKAIQTSFAENDVKCIAP